MMPRTSTRLQPFGDFVEYAFPSLSTRLTEKTGKQRHQDDSDEGDTAARHKLLHALGLGTGVVVTVAFEKLMTPQMARPAPRATTRV